jgi:hypothetical protein
VTARARELWEHLAGGGARFAPAIGAAASPHSRLCPPGWVGIVSIGDDVVASAPDEGTARVVGRALMGLSATAVTGAELLTRRLPVAEILGPAALAYLEPTDFRPAPSDVTIMRLGPGDPHLRDFLLAADPGELEESGIQEITTPAFAVREAGRVVAAAGYRDWPCRTAHLCVLTAAAARGRGLARATASAATAHAIAGGRLPQWRARLTESRRVAFTLGFREFGSQVSIRLATAGPREAGDGASQRR